MEEQAYTYSQPITEISYDFTSVSQEKHVAKRITFTSISYQNAYHLALLDVLGDGSTSDITESRNKDMRTILATVMQVIGEFLTAHPQKLVIFKGSDPRRHRLYRVLISRDLANIQVAFNIFGLIENQEAPEIFQTNQSYEYYIITKK